MGGYCSGTWKRTHKKCTTLDYLSIDIRKWKKANDLKIGAAGIHLLEKGHKVCGFVIYCLESDIVHTETIHISRNAHISTNYQFIPIEETPCHYGGTRKWFVCEECDRRVAQLFLDNKRYTCRHCLNLTYQTQQYGMEKRLHIKAKKLRTKLRLDSPLSSYSPQRPKGMHNYTYDQLLWEIHLAELRYKEALVRKMSVLGRLCQITYQGRSYKIERTQIKEVFENLNLNKDVHDCKDTPRY